MEDAVAKTPFLLLFMLVAVGINADALVGVWDGPLVLSIIPALGLTAMVPLSVGAMRVQWQNRNEQDFLQEMDHL